MMADVLAPFRKVDADEALKLVEDNGFDDLHMAFYKNQDIGNDGVWDVWQIEGPAMLWYFRGAPHVHTWVHIRERVKGLADRRESRPVSLPAAAERSVFRRSVLSGLSGAFFSLGLRLSAFFVPRHSGADFGARREPPLTFFTSASNGSAYCTSTELT